MTRPKKKAPAFIPCSPKALPPERLLAAAATAMEVNPINRPSAEMMPLLMTMVQAPGQDGVLDPQHVAILTTKYWGAGGVKLTVGFMETTAAALRDKILSHMNAWGAYCNCSFAFTQTDPQVRVSRGPGGYWSYLGTDILHVPAGEPTMNLEGFSLQTPDGEYARVVRHETGHTLGMPHEHMRRDLVALLDSAKTIAYFQRTQGWSRQVTIQQVLTPVEESSLITPTRADGTSIMCYQLPGEITLSGRPIPGGTDLDDIDKGYVAKVYPKAAPPPEGDPVTEIRVVTRSGAVVRYRVEAGGV